MYFISNYVILSSYLYQHKFLIFLTKIDLFHLETENLNKRYIEKEISSYFVRNIEI